MELIKEEFIATYTVRLTEEEYKKVKDLIKVKQTPLVMSETISKPNKKEAKDDCLF